MINLPPEHHYVRYCSPSQVQEGRILSRAFKPRERDVGTGLSGDHFEHFGTSGGDNYKPLLAALTERGFSVKPKGCFAKLECGTVTAALSGLSFEKPDEKLSHTFLKGIDTNGMISEHLALLVSETRLIEDI